MSKKAWAPIDLKGVDHLDITRLGVYELIMIFLTTRAHRGSLARVEAHLYRSAGADEEMARDGIGAVRSNGRAIGNVPSIADICLISIINRVTGIVAVPTRPGPPTALTMEVRMTIEALFAYASGQCLTSLGSSSLVKHFARFATMAVPSDAAKGPGQNSVAAFKWYPRLTLRSPAIFEANPL